MSKVYAIVTERICKSLREGVVPWRRPWKDGFAGAGPMSLSTGRGYQGINRLCLDPMLCGYRSPWWATYREVAARGGHVRAGEKASPCLYWTMFAVDDKRKGEGAKKRVPFLRYYSVFNLDQCEGLAAPTPPVGRDFSPIETCERVVAAMPKRPKIVEDGGGRCFYSLDDSVHMTARAAFRSDEGWYATLFHELTHSTGHRSRLGRDMGGSFGSKGYAREELVAEIGSAFLCAESGIDCQPIDENATAYIASWLKRLDDDPKLVVVAAGAAQRAADYILGRAVAVAVEGEQGELMAA